MNHTDETQKQNKVLSKVEKHEQKDYEKHTITIKPKDDEDADVFTQETWNTVKNSIKPKLKNIPVKKATLTKNGVGVIFFSNKNTRDEAITGLKDTYKIEVQDKKLKSILPKLRIGGIPKEQLDKVDKMEIKKEILNKNSAIQRLVESEKKVFEIIFVNDERDEQYCYAVVKVDEEIKNIILSHGRRVYLGFTSCRVTEQFHILQCYACQKFGHKMGSKECKLLNTNQSICLYCAQNHASKNCPNKGKSNLFKCQNCSSSNDKSIASGSMGHTTTSTSCPILQKNLKITMNRTVGATYRTDLPKNYIST